MERLRLIINVGLGMLFLGGGLGALGWLVATRPKPARLARVDSVPAVSVRTVEPREFAAPIVGHGTVRPKSQIHIVPQVSGEVTYSHPDLQEGKIIPQGEVLFEIDRAAYASRVQAAQADVDRLTATLKRQESERAGLERRLEVARRMRDIAEAEFAASRKLAEENAMAGAAAAVDEQQYLTRVDAVIELESRLEAAPLVQQETQAGLEAAKAKRVQAQLDLDHTRIECPFNARVESASARDRQFVTAHLAIAMLTDIDALEISASIDPRDLRWMDPDVFAYAMGRSDVLPARDVAVHWTLYGQAFAWSGRVTRFERVDESTRTARIVVEVRDIDISLSIGAGASRPPLSIGMFCRTEIPTAPLKAALTVPRHVINDNAYVYVFEPEGGGEAGAEFGRLGLRRVPMLRAVGDDVLVAYAPHAEQAGGGPAGDGEGEALAGAYTNAAATEGDFAEAAPAGESGVCELAAGELVIVSPLSKPVVGMRIRMRDEAVATLGPAAPAVVALVDRGENHLLGG